MMDEENEEPLTDEQLVQVFVFEVENQERVTADFLPDQDRFSLDRSAANAAVKFIKERLA